MVKMMAIIIYLFINLFITLFTLLCSICTNISIKQRNAKLNQKVKPR